MKKQEKERNKSKPFFHINFFLTSMNNRTQGNSRELEGSRGNSRETLVEMEGKNSGKGVQRENLENRRTRRRRRKEKT